MTSRILDTPNIHVLLGDTVNDEIDWVGEASTVSGSDESLPQPCFDTVEEFVRWLLVVHRQRITQWCPQWWRHAEAVFRLTALWHAFEALRVQPGTGLAVWIRDYMDPCLDRLCGPDTSTFRQCNHRDGKHSEYASWPIEPAPEGHFTPEQSAATTSGEAL